MFETSYVREPARPSHARQHSADQSSVNCIVHESPDHDLVVVMDFWVDCGGSELENDWTAILNTPLCRRRRREEEAAEGIPHAFGTGQELGGLRQECKGLISHR